MKKLSLVFTVLMALGVLMQAQNTLTDNDLNFRKASYNSSYIVTPSNSFILNATGSISQNVQEARRMHLMVYGTLEKFGLGIGAKVNTRFKDLYKTTTAEMLFSKGMYFKNGHGFNLGLNFGVYHTALDMDYFNTYVEMSDATIMEEPEQRLRFIAGFGASYTWKDALTVGYSMPALVKTESDFYQTIFANASYKQELGAGQIYIEPSVLLYTTAIAPTTFEGAATIGYENYAWFKVGGRTTKTMLVGAGGGIDFVNVGYVYNHNFGDYSNINQSQHNINVCFDFLQGKEFKKKVVEPVEVPDVE